MNEDFLNKFRKEPRTEFAASLYERINKPMQTQSKSLTRRIPALSLVALCILTMTLFLSPSARAFANGFIRQVGGYIFSDGTVNQTNKTPSEIGIVRTHDSVSIVMKKDLPTAADTAQAGKLASFSVLAPAYLPDGYSAMSEWIVTSDSSGVTTSRGYKDTTNNFFVINELKKGAGAPEQAFHEDNIVDVTVRGQPGVWLPGSASSNGKDEVKKALVWDENGITYSLITNSLSLDEMLKVAESLGK